MSDQNGPDRETFHRDLRRACATVYRDELGVEPELAPMFGDALAFYASVSGLGWNVGRSLANAGLFYPNRIRKMSDEQLLAVKGIGPASLRRFRQVINTDLASDLSTTELMDAILRMDAELSKT